MRDSRLAAMLSVFTAFACTACSPFMFRAVDDGVPHEDGKQKTETFFYAYGQFCGAGYPTNLHKLGRDGRDRTLSSLYPPHDDLDAICYAHDACYADKGTNHVTCDSVLLHMMIKYENEFVGKGCWNVSTDVVIAFFGKFWEKGRVGTETMANRLVGVAMGVPTAIFWAVLKAPTRPFAPNPKVVEGLGALGTCNLESVSDPDKMFVEFETGYLTALFNDQHRSFWVPRPVVTTRN